MRLARALAQRLAGCLAGCLVGYLVLLPARAADALPEALRGVWAEANTELDERLVVWGGNALYLTADGRGALVGAPLPVRSCDGLRCAPRMGIPVLASRVDAGLRLQLPGSSPSLRVSWDEMARTLTLASPDGENRVMTRRAPALPVALARELGLSP